MRLRDPADGPDGVQFITTRLPFRNTGIADDLRLIEDLEQHARLLADADVTVIAVNCTAATLLAGPARGTVRLVHQAQAPARKAGDVRVLQGAQPEGRARRPPSPSRTASPRPPARPRPWR